MKYAFESFGYQNLHLDALSLVYWHRLKEGDSLLVFLTGCMTFPEQCGGKLLSQCSLHAWQSIKFYPLLELSS